jgi:methionyl-tRNA synthetase
VVSTHHDLWKRLHISNDDFIRTTEPRHRDGVYELIRRIRERNPDDIYLGEHSGWYCQSEETFIPENQVKDGTDQDGHKVEWTTERNYFFRLSRYAQPLLEHYRANPGFVWPPTRLNEVVSFVEQGLKDLSISRSSIKWGIPFPGDPEHVIYVWMDALTNYISALGFGSGDTQNVDRYWPADIHLIGKDIVRFHAVYWPAFLMSAGVELPKRVVGHGFWLRDQQKISKSLGNVVRPYNILDDFGADALRYYVTREMVFGQDQDYSDQALLTRYNADLANDLGNTLSRAIKMSDSYFGGKTPPITCYVNDLLDAVDRVVPQYLRYMDELAFQRAIESVWELLNAINTYIVTREPWRRFKENGADDALGALAARRRSRQDQGERLALGRPADQRAAARGRPDLPARRPRAVHRRKEDGRDHTTDRDDAGGGARHRQDQHRSVHGSRSARGRSARGRARPEIEEAAEADDLHRRGRAHHRGRHRHEVRAGGAGRTEGRHRGEPAAGEADGRRVERDGAGGVDRGRAESRRRRCGRAGRHKSSLNAVQLSRNVSTRAAPGPTLACVAADERWAATQSPRSCAMHPLPPAREAGFY